ncbi:MAG: helix-turn-helix transcriptional regulator [Pseudomonadota bacterium]
MSQEQLGDALGLTFQQVQKYEKGLNRIGAGRLYHIARILSVQPSYFYEGLPDVEEDLSDPELAERTASTAKFLATPEGYSIVCAVSRIEDVSVRRRILDLAKAVGEA